jgi:ornithine cyclodeaminase
MPATWPIIGAGVQARTHLAAIACVRKLKRIRIAARRFESAKLFVKEMQNQSSCPIEPVEANEAAVRGADIIVTVTTTREPVVNREWVSPAHTLTP